MAIENLPLFSAMNREEVKPCHPHPHRPFTSQEAHFEIIEKVNACISEVNHFEERVRHEVENFFAKSNTENNAFKEAIQASYNTFMQTIQREVNNFETSSQNNFDLFRNDIDKRVADFETAINNSFEALQTELVKVSDGKIEELNTLKVDLNSSFTNYKAELNAIVQKFTVEATQHAQLQDSKIEDYKNYMVDNILSNTRKIFNEKASNGEIEAIMTAVYGSERTFKGSKTFDEIQAIENAGNGDYYYCTTDKHYYQRTESDWVDIGTGEKILDDYEAFRADVYRRLDVNFVTNLMNIRLNIDSATKKITLIYENQNKPVNVIYANNAWTMPLKLPYTLDLTSYTNTASPDGFSAFIVYNKSADNLQIREFNNLGLTNKMQNDDFVLCGLFFNSSLEITNYFGVNTPNIYFNGVNVSPLNANECLPVAWVNGYHNYDTDFKINIDTANKLIEIISPKNNLLFCGVKGFISLQQTISLDLSEREFSTSGATEYLVFETTKKIALKKEKELKHTDRIIATIWYDGSFASVRKIICDNNIKDIIYVNNTKYFKEPTYEINNFTTINNEQHACSDVGCVDYMEIGETDYSQIILYGQSLGMGWECPEVITTGALKNCYMVGSSPLINHGNNGASELKPLVAVKWQSGGEQPIVSATHAFAKMYNRFVNRSQKFIGTTCGEGGRSIERLMKQSTHEENHYTNEFLAGLEQTKNAVEAENKTVSCSAIVFMQGEYNYAHLTGAGLSPDTDATNDKEQYKAYLKQLKEDMQSDIMLKYNQSKKPLFFIYQVAGTYINHKGMRINMAQVEFAQENEDVILLNSTYGVPDYNGGHLSTNGYRWYGELIAKQLYKVFVKGENFKSVNVENIEISENTIKLHCHVPVAPLVFDTHTKEAIDNHGFRVYMNNSNVAINSIEIKGSVIEITCAKNLSGTIEIEYGGYNSSGSGNLRDSDNYTSMYTYYDDRETAPTKREQYTPKNADGEFIYGEHYPLYNWCNQFYYTVTI